MLIFSRHRREETFNIVPERFATTGSVHHPKTIERITDVTNENSWFEVIASVVEDPQVSTRQISANLYISKTSVNRILNLQNFTHGPLHLNKS